RSLCGRHAARRCRWRFGRRTGSRAEELAPKRLGRRVECLRYGGSSAARIDTGNLVGARRARPIGNGGTMCREGQAGPGGGKRGNEAPAAVAARSARSHTGAAAGQCLAVLRTGASAVLQLRIIDAKAQLASEGAPGNRRLLATIGQDQTALL